MKAFLTSDAIGVILVAVALFIMFTQIFPRLLSTIVESFSQASGENVARQLAGLITASGVAPYEIKIDYIPTTEHTYRVIVEDRILTVVPKFQVAYAEKASSTQPFAVDLQTYEEDDVNHFVVEKDFDGESIYVFQADKQ